MHKLFTDIARLPLRLIPKSAVVPILSGPNRGNRWIVGSGQHGCWIGSYERNYAKQVASEIEPGMVVFDLGAHAGYYTLMMSARVGPSGKVFAFEANADNAANLRRHLRINRISNVEVVEAAVSAENGMANFCDDGYIGHLLGDGRPVPTVRLDNYPTPDFIKMDIEGAEGLAMRGAHRILSSKKSVWFVAVHAEPARTECVNAFRSANYRFTWVAPSEFFARPDGR
jgi:FkbM family methyltransferase